MIRTKRTARSTRRAFSRGIRTVGSPRTGVGLSHGEGRGGDVNPGSFKKALSSETECVIRTAVGRDNFAQFCELQGISITDQPRFDSGVSAGGRVGRSFASAGLARGQRQCRVHSIGRGRGGRNIEGDGPLSRCQSAGNGRLRTQPHARNRVRWLYPVCSRIG